MKAIKHILNSLEQINLASALIALITVLFLSSSLDIRIVFSISLSALFFISLAVSKHLWQKHSVQLFFAWLCFFCGLGLVFFIHLLPMLMGVISTWF